MQKSNSKHELIKKTTKENSSQTVKTKGKLSKIITDKLQDGLDKGFKDDTLDLFFLNINDKMIPEICEWITKLDSKVKVLKMHGNELRSKGAILLLDTLRTRKIGIQNISLNNNQLDDDCMKSLGEFIKSNKAIEYVDISNNYIKDKGIDTLASYLEYNSSLRYLMVSGNKGITDRYLPIIMSMVYSSNIEEIDVSFTSIRNKESLFFLLLQNKIKNGAKKLILDKKDINDEVLSQICKSIKQYGADNLKIISLVGNTITSQGVSELFDTLREHKSAVRMLYLNGNLISDEGMKSLGEYLEINEHLEILDLTKNRITDKGIEILCEHLIGNACLQELRLGINDGITNASVPCLIETAMKSSLTRITLERTIISEENRIEIGNQLIVPVILREIPVKSSSKSAAKSTVYSSSSSW